MFGRRKRSKTDKSKMGNLKVRSRSTTSINNNSGGNLDTQKKEVKIFSLIKSGNWPLMTNLLRSNIGREITTAKDKTDLNVLGAALGSRAPTDVIALILELNPNLVTERDSYGAVPLHLGCLNGISPEVMNLIFQYDGGKSAHIPDSDNRTALHHAVEFSCKITMHDDSSVVSMMYEESIEIIEQLLSIAPETVLYVTSRGDCPLDIPHEFKIKYVDKKEYNFDEIYSIIKEASIELYREMKTKWELAGYNMIISRQQIGKPESSPSLVSSSLASSTKVTSILTCTQSSLYEDIGNMSLSSTREN